tara:strand:+ start:1075 stop:1530 length:456 start_codon:yes stop_codon:yes gene_type:complete
MKILMVCLGNICRSPLAEGILRNKAKNLKIEIDSAGTASYHIGNPPDYRSIKIAKKYRIDISKQSARKITKEDFEIFDIIYAMDLNNYNDIIKMTNNPIHKEKVRVILNEIYPKMNHSVPDPYYGGENGFQDVYNLLDRACNKIIEKIEKR